MTATTTDHVVHREPRRAPEAPVGRSTGWWGMVLFIATEAATFACVIASYFYLRFVKNEGWPPPSDKLPDLLLTSIGTGVLILSCVPMTLAVFGARRRHGAGAGFGVLFALAGGVAFVVLQILDWLGEWPSSTLSKDAYGSLFYSLTGLHTFHVTIGLGMLLFLLAGALSGRTGRGHWEPVAIVALYWYFMAVLAVAVYVTVYISPYL